MMTPDRLFAALGAVSGLLAVAGGAFGAHALRARLTPELLTIFETGVRYHMYHAIALFAVAWASARWGGALFVATGWLFVVGTVIFSGSLYTLSLSGARLWGAVTPIGGLCFLAGWGCLIWGIVTAR